MASAKGGFTYQGLRVIVMALHNQGMLMKQPGLTFSHGNTGNELLALAGEIDVIVRDSEPYKKYYLFEAEQVEKDNEFARKMDRQREEVIASLQEFVQEVGKTVGLPFTVTDDVLKNVKNLKAINKDLHAEAAQLHQEVLRLQGIISTRGLKPVKKGKQ